MIRNQILEKTDDFLGWQNFEDLDDKYQVLAIELIP